MEKEEWIQLLKSQTNALRIDMAKEQLKKFYDYMQMLRQWNENINLTAIIEPKDILQKHFIDSLTIMPYITKNARVVDVGTGAGFPAIPIKIADDTLQITLIDALNKRLNFLKEVIDQLDISNVQIVHTRAEDAGKNKALRENFDIAVSRAVAPMQVLVEYLLPLVKVGGQCICMKGSNIEEELKDSKKAISILGGEIEQVVNFDLPNSDIARNVVVIKKIAQTPIKYPRKPGTPAKDPIK